MHWHASDEALRDGDTPERLTLLDAWEESPRFDEKERAVLRWAEEITLITDRASQPEIIVPMG